MIARVHSVDENIRLQPWHRWSLYVATAVLFASGVLWLALHYVIPPPTGEFGQTTHPLEPWTLRVHGLAVLVALFFYGSLLRAHIIKAWKRRRNRVSGACMGAVLGLLTISGYLLYYSGGESLRAALSVTHWGIGLALAGVLPLHIYYGRQTRSKQRTVSRSEHADAVSPHLQPARRG